MFEGRNKIEFSPGTAKKIVGEYLSKLFQVPIEVTGLDMGTYSTIDVTFEEVQKPETSPAVDENSGHVRPL